MTVAPVEVGPYSLSESVPAGYSASDWVCTGGASTTATTVTLAEGQNATCTIVNTAIPSKLTLEKTVDNGTTGGTTLPTAWTLAAAGPTPISGATGSAAVTNATVKVGTYALSESNGPTGYRTGD